MKADAFAGQIERRNGPLAPMLGRLPCAADMFDGEARTKAGAHAAVEAKQPPVGAAAERSAEPIDQHGQYPIRAQPLALETEVHHFLEGIAAATHRELGFEIINLGGSHPVELNRLIELLETTLGKRALIDRQSMQPGDVPVTYADVSKARRLLGYEPKVDITAGLQQFAAWFFQRPG